MALFLGMAGASLRVAGSGAMHLTHPSGALILRAGAVYLVGRCGVMIVIGVPMNDALAGIDRPEITLVGWAEDEAHARPTDNPAHGRRGTA